MKYFKSILCVLLVCALFSGCSFRIASSIDELISPVSPFGENKNIQNAMDSFAPNGYSLKNPTNGEFTASYNFYDFDDDGQDEAIAFYEPADKLGTIRMALLDMTDNEWSVVESIDGEGKSVYSLAFDDINNDGKNEIMICWDLLPNSTNHQLSIYTVGNDESEYTLTAVDSSLTIIFVLISITIALTS